MTALAIRWIHLAASLGLVGLITMTLLAGRSDRPTARQWDARVWRLAGWLVLLFALSGVALLAHQSALAAGRPGAAFDPAAWRRLLFETRFGAVWLIRHAVLLLLASLLLLRESERAPLDWMAWRVQAWMLAALAAGALAWAGHAVAVESAALAAPLLDTLHVLAAGTWLGALLPLALLLRAASAEAGADGRPFAVLAARRFSAVALGAMTLLVATGLWNAWVQVASIPALVGTRYGWLLLAKVALLAPVLALAVINRRRLIPSLSGDAAAVGRPAMTRLGRFLRWESGLAMVILGVTAALSLMAPARHETPWWPFSYRLSYEATAELPGVNARLLIGGQLAVLGLLGGIVGALLRSRRVLLLAAGAAAVVAGLWIALPPLAVDAYPTTYRRSPVPYQAASVTSGMALYGTHCATCHGASGRGDGPGGAGLPKLPADLTAPHTAQHTAGDLFWWLTRGITAAGMPAFGSQLAEEQRWDVINFLRALAAGAQARQLGPVVRTGAPQLVAPDFSFAVGPTPPRALRDLRGRSVVLLVLFSLPDSRLRLAELAAAYAELGFAGAEIIAIPMDGEREIIRRLGANRPPFLFPVVTDGAAEIVPTYALLAGEPRPLGQPPHLRHAELLIDRQGYVRGRWLPGTPGWEDLHALRGQIQTLARETPTSPPPDEHVH